MRTGGAEDWPRVARLLDGALTRPLDQRSAYLDRACAGDGALRARVEAMLARADAVAFLDRPAAAFAAPLLDVAEARADALDLDALIGPYRVIREIGRGGMGTVYLAERADGQFEQRVALKVVKRGMDSDEILRRFLAERQILARLHHPNIARLLDGGVTADGRPWFGMEYVEGRPITAHGDARRLDLDQRLRLFESACDAVRYAHQNLVIHRDLKPSNVLVTENGDVKLLDFGIAKLLHADPADSGAGAGPVTLTEVGARVLTPEYAAPEQVRGEPVTTATDVYALGSVLYELLSGHRAHRVERHSPAEVERVVCGVDPPEPSAVVQRPVEVADAAGWRETTAPATVASDRGTSPDRLRRLLQGDLDTIVLKALRKDPARRYLTVEALLDDLRRYRSGLPVQARPDSRTYRAGKFVRRHRLGAAAAAAVLLSLVGGLAGTVWQARSAAQQAVRAEREAAKALREAATAREVKDFVVGLFEVSDPAESRGREITARELLARGVRRVDTALATQPAVQSELLGVLGVIHRELGLYLAADTLLERAAALARAVHGDSAPEVAQRLGDWATVLLAQGEYDRADSLLLRALAIRRRALPDAHPDVAVSLDHLAAVQRRRGNYARAESLYRQALRIDRAHYGGEHTEVAQDLNNLGVALWEAGKLAAAESAYGEALAIERRLLDPDHPRLITSLGNLASLRESQGDHAAAERLRHEVLERRRRIFPADHPDVARALQNLASGMRAQERLAEAEALDAEALAIFRARLGAKHPETLEVVNNIGIGRYLRGDFKGSAKAFREVIAAWERTIGATHRHTLIARENLAGALQFQGEVARAEALFREVLALRRKTLGGAHRDVGSSLFFLGRLLYDKGDRTGAEQAFRESLKIRRAALPVGAPQLGWPLAGLGEVLTDRGKASEAEPLLREALAIWLKEYGPTHHRTAAAQRGLGACLAAAGRQPEGEALLLTSYRALDADRSGWRADYEKKKTLGRLVRLHEGLGDRAEAARYRTLLAAME